jgi:hypothetical protein
MSLLQNCIPGVPYIVCLFLKPYAGCSKDSVPLFIKPYSMSTGCAVFFPPLGWYFKFFPLAGTTVYGRRL